MNNIIYFLLIHIFSCDHLVIMTTDPSVILPTSSMVTLTNPYRWTKLLDHAPWSKSYNFQLFSNRDTIWTFHGEGNWYSLDGRQWTKSRLPNTIHNLAFLDYILFKNSIFGLGHFEGNIESYQFKPEIYQSIDFRSWSILSTTSNIPPRFFYHPFVFKEKMWIIGGEDKNRKYSDVWNSRDGIQWAIVKENLAFGLRSGSQIVELKGVLYLLNNDVWRSSDGVQWTKVTDEIVKGQTIFGYAALTYDEKIWLLGCNRNGQFTSQVYFSKNGKDWQSMDAPWSPRGGIAATVHQGKIYMTGGKYGGTPDHPEFRYDHDVWVLERR